MKKSEVLTELSRRCSNKSGGRISCKTVELVTNELLNIIMENVSQGGQVSFLGFGTFGSVERHEHFGVNPRTKERITIPRSITPTFKASRVYKKALNK